MRVLGFAATSSSRSINRHLVAHALRLLSEELALGTETELVDLNEYEMPIYSQDREDANGIPGPAKELFAKIGAADALIISFAEHNGSYSAAFKNIYDWMSRIDMRVYQNRPAVYFATSPGRGGGRNVLAAAVSAAPHFGAEVRAELAVPRFPATYDVDRRAFIDEDIGRSFTAAVKTLTDDG